MKGFIKGIMSLAASLLLASCTYRDLKVVECAMETDPVIADSLLAAFSMPERGRSQALYALLKTQIDYKMYRDADSDSLIRVATDYYGRKYKGYHAAMAWYSLGCISAELGNDSTAADAYLSALSLFPDTLVRYYALTEQNLSYIFLEHNMDDEAIQLIKSCRLNACRLADSAAIAFCDYNIARSLLYNNEYDSAQTMFIELSENKWLAPNIKNIPLLELSKIALFNDNDSKKSLEYIDLFLQRNNHINSYGLAYSIKADAYYFNKELDSAYYYYRLSLNETQNLYTICDAYRRLSEIETINGHRDSATYYANLASSWMDSIVVNTNSEIILRSLLNHLQSTYLHKRNQYSFLGIIVFSVTILIILSLLIYFKIRRNRSSEDVCQNVKLEMNTNNANVQKNEETRTIKISDFMNDIYAFKQSELYNIIAERIINHEEPGPKQKHITRDSFRKELIKLRSYISTSSKVNDDDIDFCIFTLLGFKQRDFYIISDVLQSRTLKCRLKSKMPTELFLQIFSSDNEQ